MRRLPVFDDIGILAEQSAPLDRDAGCTRCELHASARSVCMGAELAPGRGSNRVALILGASPSEQEDRQGRPFISASGAYVRKLAGEAWEGTLVFDYAIRCALGAKKPKAKQRDACRPYLAATLSEAFPERILALGSDAMIALLGRGFLAEDVDRGYAWTADGAAVFLLPHPIQALRNRFKRAAFEASLRWALSMPLSELQRPPSRSQALIVETAEDARRAASVLASFRKHALDTETFGAVGNRVHCLLSLAIAAVEAEVYVWPFEQLQAEETRAPLAALLQQQSAVKLAHNAKFDAQHCERAGLPWRGPVADTFLTQKLARSHMKADLATLQFQIGMAGGKKAAGDFMRSKGRAELAKLANKPEVKPALFAWMPPELLEGALADIRRNGWEGEDLDRYAFAAIPRDELLTYNARDTLSLLRLDPMLERQAAGSAVLAVRDCIALPLSAAITEIERAGIYVDQSRLAELQRLTSSQIAELEGALAEAGAGEVNINSPDQLAALLYDKLKLKEPRQRTATGKRKVVASHLESLHHPVVSTILKLKKARHFRSQYADGMLRFVQDDGRIHPGFRIAGTKTGRPSCSSPNLLNIPRARSQLGKLARDVFAARPGFKLVELDYSQIELRVAAMLSGDPLMRQLFIDGVDFHLATAQLIAPLLGVDPAVVTGEHILRDQAKVVNFATLYGDPIAGLAFKLGVKMDVAEKLQSAILGKFATLKSWIAERLRFARQHGYCRTWWEGEEFRTRYLWDIGEPSEELRLTAERSSWNTPIQGTAADFTNASIGEIHRKLQAQGAPAQLVLTVYDSIIAEVADAFVPDYIKLARGVMTSWDSQGVPLVADCKVGQNWGSMESEAA